MVEQYKQKASLTELCSWLNIPRSSYYHKPSNQKRGRKPSTHTAKIDGSVVENKQVVTSLLKEVFNQEFVRYGYQLSTEELQELGYIINEKKVYRLMKESGLLFERVSSGRIKRNWVKWRTVSEAKPLEHICMDIKYVYIHGQRRNAYLLAIMDIATRWVLGWAIKWSMKHPDVIVCLHTALRGYNTNSITLRTDNGSQFIANGLQKYLDSQEITHEFTHVATPEENAYVESLFSCVDREVIQAYQFENIHHAKDVFERYFDHHNIKRRRHALGRKSPLQYWNSQFHSHPVKPPTAQNGGFDKGDDTFINNNLKSSFIISLSDPKCGLSLLNKDENMKGNVLNLFEKSVQKIGG